jgi:hypoxanthine-DNA glycosylase
MAPVGSANATLLILGSLPGDASLLAQRYYAHPRNQFWHLLGRSIGEDLASLPYDDRLARLAARRIALWDVIAEARRTGSLDGAIRESTSNPLHDYVLGHPDLGAVAFNGGTASRFGRSALGELPGVAMVDLPSSSPAYTLPVDDKIERWAVLRALAWPAENATLSR